MISCVWLLGPALTAGVLDLELPEIRHGRKIRPLERQGQKATVLFFVLHDCPISNSYAPEMNRIVAEYGPGGFNFALVYVDPTLTADQARTHSKDYGFECPAVLDSTHALVRLTGATVSPEAAVLSPEGELLYRGRIDDRVVAFGKKRTQPRQRDLRLALDAVLAKKPITAPITKAIGCYIPELQKEKGK